jgi:hypothetical protein
MCLMVGIMQHIALVFMGEAEGYCMTCGLQNRSIPVTSLMEAAVSSP